MAPFRGTPEGAEISPVLATIYLHYVLDLWCAKRWRPKEARVETRIVRYADDVVLGFQSKMEAEQFLNDVRERLAKFGLRQHLVKTRLIEFGRKAATDRAGRGQWRPETFDFLGVHALLPNHTKGALRPGAHTDRQEDESEVGGTMSATQVYACRYARALALDGACTERLVE